MSDGRTGPDRRTAVPGVEKVAQAVRRFVDEEPAIVHAAVRAVLAEERERLARGGNPRPAAELGKIVQERIVARRPMVPTAINGTGVILHTNLGRAPWSARAINAASVAAQGYLLLEIDRATGRRGRRFSAAEQYIVELTRANDALIVNNNAAALALAVRLAGRGGGVAVSRGELVEIGGGVRIPELVRRAGSRLVEVGTTNRTNASDYADVFIAGAAKVLLSVHASNFRMDGFVRSPQRRELARVASEHGVPFIEDLGSGALIDTATFDLPHEPTPMEAVAEGADIVTFSGDKLLGGPQAGFIVGHGGLIDRIRKDPLTRAARPDKVTLAAVAETLDSYRRGRATEELPVWRMISARTADLELRREGILSRLPASAMVERVAIDSSIGGGALPGVEIPSVGIAVCVNRPDAVASGLRHHDPAVIGRIVGGKFVIDLRTVAATEDGGLARALSIVLART
ncbi:MAG: L-seryl-tRNA(Sec) selenium transferase [Chloroflexota bacterium]|nr:L-seryl-tRNA(Sec) selenium transferase [Chloroflexota bacterium]